MSGSRRHRVKFTTVVVAGLVACAPRIESAAPAEPTRPSLGHLGAAVRTAEEGEASDSTAVDERLTGDWFGAYEPADAVPGMGSVPFTATVVVARGQLTGRTVEPNTFGAAAVTELLAELEGSVTADGEVRFVKTYDGTGGVDHAVSYQGRLSEDGTAIEGWWSLADARGQFRMVRATP